MNVYHCRPYTLRSALASIARDCAITARRTLGDWADQRHNRRQRLKAARHLERCLRAPMAVPLKRRGAGLRSLFTLAAVLALIVIALIVITIDAHDAWPAVLAWLPAGDAASLMAQLLGARVR